MKLQQNIKRKWLLLVSVLIILLISSASVQAASSVTPELTICSSDAISNGTISRASTKVSLSINIKAGTKTTLTYSLSPATSVTKVKWSSSNKKVAKVNSKGVVTGVSSGTATIKCTVTSKGKKITSSCKVKVISGQKYEQRGTITNAVTGQPIAKAKLNFRKGYDVKTGAIYAKTTTDERGRYSTKLEKGKYTIEISKSGFVTSYINYECKAAVTDYENHAISTSISPTLSTEKWRIVLTWGSTPSDLDSHLTGPLSSSSSRFHIYFSNKYAYDNNKLVANLDIDDTNSYGPETTTINFDVAANGTYNYYVHDYSNRFSAHSTELGNSGARVVVYKGNSQIATYTVPKIAGTNWFVFKIENGILKTVNQMSYSSNIL